MLRTTLLHLDDDRCSLGDTYPAIEEGLHDQRNPSIPLRELEHPYRPSTSLILPDTRTADHMSSAVETAPSDNLRPRRPRTGKHGDQLGIGTVSARPDNSGSKTVLVMVGLPARGKSYFSNKLMTYLKWLEYNVKVFNVDQLRHTRARENAQQVKEDDTTKRLSHNNMKTTEPYDKLDVDSLEMLIEWLKEGGNVGIYDAMNGTRSIR